MKLSGKESDEEFASLIAKNQLQNEINAESYAENHFEKYVIICDRSLIEPAAYIGIEKLSNILSKYEKDFEQTRDSYDLVIHLTTTAKGASEFYTLKNNEARNENKSKAIVLDDNILQIWNGHPNRIIVDNSENGFDEKLEKINNIIICFLKCKV